MKRKGGVIISEAKKQVLPCYLLELPFELFFFHIVEYLDDISKYLLFCTTPGLRQRFLDGMTASYEGYTNLRIAWFCEQEKNSIVYTRVAPYVWQSGELMARAAMKKMHDLIGRVDYRRTDETLRCRRIMQNTEKWIFKKMMEVGYSHSNVVSIMTTTVSDYGRKFLIPSIRLEIECWSDKKENNADPDAIEERFLVNQADVLYIPQATVGISVKEFREFLEEKLISKKFKYKSRQKVLLFGDYNSSYIRIKIMGCSVSGFTTSLCRIDVARLLENISTCIETKNYSILKLTKDISKCIYCPTRTNYCLPIC